MELVTPKYYNALKGTIQYQVIIPMLFDLTRLLRRGCTVCVEAKGPRILAKALRDLTEGLRVEAKVLRVLARALLEKV
ncbi:unnamed protein product [Echinostoma caproni]|uniref:AbrB/MazE/SpoVT family DNA-binding domain-containing protein n=1 Tax=Echinostoma caproni TaxID=27848 RepID=A0A183A4Z7_9TREM|nr:unnamed protein product [Echinostoma caproni]